MEPMPRRLATPGEVPDNPHLWLDDVVAPDVVLDLAAGRRVTPVWRNEIGGITFSIAEGVEYVKVGPAHREFAPAAEAERLRWLAGYVHVPTVLGFGGAADGTVWLHTAGLPGTSAVLGEWLTQPERVVPALGRALRAFHDAVPVDGCPWTWSVTERLRAGNLPAGLLGSSPDDDLVVCHGDACNPNFIFDRLDAESGYVDVGQCGVADRWADLAPALLSLGWNYGAGWEAAFLDGYRIDVDQAKLDFYTRVWELPQGEDSGGCEGLVT
jgi:Aminoglycoside phosphotransferase